MANDEPDAVVVCMRVGDMPTSPVPGTTKRACGECGEDVWVSPATKRSIARGNYPDVIRCMYCTSDALEAKGDGNE